MPGLITHRAQARLVRKINAMQKALQQLGSDKGKAAGEFLSDWHDNFAYDQLDREYQMMGKRIEELNALLNGCQLVEVAEQNAKVSIGSTVEYTLNGEAATVTIGCSSESEPDMDLIAYDCPLGRLLMGMQAGSAKKGKLGPREVEIKIARLHLPSFRYNNLQEELDAKDL